MEFLDIVKFVDIFLNGEMVGARRLIRHEMESMLDPLVESLFGQLKVKFKDYLDVSYSSGCFLQEEQLEHDEQMNRDQPTILKAHQYHSHSLSNGHSMDANCQVNSTNHQPALKSIKQEINGPSNVILEPQQNLIKSSSTNSSTSTDESLHNKSQLQLAHNKHKQFGNEEKCESSECFDGETEGVMNDEDEGDSVDWFDGNIEVEEPSFRPVKIPRLDTAQPNNAQAEMTGLLYPRQPIYEEQMHNGTRQVEQGDRIESEQKCEAIETRATIEHCSRYNSDESMVIQQEEKDANNTIEEEIAIATECTTNPIQLNLAQTNRNLQCSHCHKSFDYKSALHKHLRTHSGERPYLCRFCAMSFTQLGSRNAHEQAIHLHVKPYRCKVCDYTCTRKSTMLRHVRFVHFRLPRSIKQQRALNIIDHRDPWELIEKV